jgi:hypothetical protein
MFLRNAYQILHGVASQKIVLFYEWFNQYGDRSQQIKVIYQPMHKNKLMDCVVTTVSCRRHAQGEGQLVALLTNYFRYMQRLCK